MNYSDIHLKQIEALFKKAQLSFEYLSIQKCTNGGNNRIYRIETTDGNFAVKKYFREPTDTRDRLNAEFSFLNYAKKAAADFVPYPYVKDENEGIALYEFVEGRSFQTNDVTKEALSQASKFFCLLNDKKFKEKASKLPLASEAGFSIQDHFKLVSDRIKNLRDVILNGSNQDAKLLIKKLSDYWRLTLEQCTKAASKKNINIEAKLDHNQICISPSDFGFHNALIKKNRVRFLDFEYAGWDDPAKMVGDFFSQLAVPIPAQYFESFVSEVMAPFSESEFLVQRANLLRPIYQIKWCCIALNVFIPVHLARRRFANPELDVINLQRVQLSKAESILKNL